MVTYIMKQGKKEYVKRFRRMELADMIKFAKEWVQELPRGGVYEIRSKDKKGEVKACATVWPKTAEFRKTVNAQGKATYYIDGKRVSERIYKTADKVLVDKSCFKTITKPDGKVIQEHTGRRIK